MSTVNYWYSNIEYKQQSLSNIFGACLVYAALSSMFILAFGRFTIEDIALVPLLLLTLLAAFPYVEVAVKANSSSTSPRVLTAVSYKKHIFNVSSKYTILTSRLGVFQPIYATLCIISFLLISINKIFGDEMINKKTVVGFLILQVPFNPLLGFNPIPVRLLRMPESRFVTQNSILQSLQSYESQTFSPNVIREQDILNTSTQFQLRNTPLKNTTTNTPVQVLKNITTNTPQPSKNRKNRNDSKTRNRNKELLSILKNM